MTQLLELQEIVIGEKIRAVREALKMSQTQFGKLLTVTQDTISNYETGKNKPYPRMVNTIIEVFGINREWWETGNGEMFVKGGMNVVNQQEGEFNINSTGSHGNRIHIRDHSRRQRDQDWKDNGYPPDFGKSINVEKKHLEELNALLRKQLEEAQEQLRLAQQEKAELMELMKGLMKSKN